MSFVLTLKPGSTVSCGHGQGKVATSSTAKLQVNGAAVLLEGGVMGKSVTVCGTVLAFDMSGTTTDKPCSSVLSVSPGSISTKLQAGGLPVLLDTLKGTTDGMVAKTTPQTLLAGTAVQTKLTAV